MAEKKRILVCPLDWGLGHATRCVPVIHELLAQGAEVIIAADGRPLKLLQQEFPGLEALVFKGYDIEYPSGDGMVVKMALSAPRILKRIADEGKELEGIIKKHRIDAVISDNRYGLCTSQVPSVFIIHQLMIKSPFGEAILNKITKNYIKKYSECWVPDNEGEHSLSGDLANKFPIPDNTKFVGPLSRFKSSDSAPVEKKYDLLVLISGPEPQRSKFEEIVIKQLEKLEGSFCIVAGKPGENKPEPTGSIEYYGHLDTPELQKKIMQADIVLSRPGYSTIMDLAVLGSKAIFVPTPGQTEQEYLGERYMKMGQHYSVRQKELNLKLALEEAKKYSGFSRVGENVELRKVVQEFLSKLG